MQPGWQTLNVAAQDGDPNSLLTTYRTWGQLRETSDALQQGTFVPLETEDRQVFAFLRVHEDETMLIVINLGSEQSDSVVLTLPEGAPGPLTNALTGESLPDSVAGDEVTIPALPARDGVAFVVDVT
jgi:glycosidase